MIGTLLRIRKYIRDTKKGIANPSDFVFEQLTEAALIPFIIPGLILLILLGITGALGFSNIITHGGNTIGKIFFWILFVFAAITTIGMIVVYRGARILWKKAARHMNVEGKNLRDITNLQNK